MTAHKSTILSISKVFKEIKKRQWIFIIIIQVLLFTNAMWEIDISTKTKSLYLDKYAYLLVWYWGVISILNLGVNNSSYNSFLLGIL